MLLGIITYLTVRGGDITSNGRALVRTQSIVAQHNQTTANVLRYLHILEDAGIIVSGKIGTDIFWRLA